MQLQRHGWDIHAVSAGFGLRLDRYLTDDRGWLRAVPA
jgi:hypothetical protein